MKNDRDLLGTPSASQLAEALSTQVTAYVHVRGRRQHPSLLQFLHPRLDFARARDYT